MVVEFLPCQGEVEEVLHLVDLEEHQSLEVVEVHQSLGEQEELQLFMSENL